MDGDIVSAGTFVASILEHAGYLTQARFMENFKDFFRDAGALVYFIGAVGGLLSLVFFGSFRAAQYLLIGPALYWFLVGPIKEVDGVVAKLGDGTPRGFVGEVGLDSAKSTRDKVIEKSGETPTQKIKVAEGFWLFVKPINDFVEEFVGIMLKDEDEADLAAASKVRGLEAIARSMPNDHGTIQLLENEILKNCMDSYSHAFGAAQNYIKSTVTQGLSPKNSAVNRAKHQESFETAKKNFLDIAKKTSISINANDTPVLKSLIEEHGRSSQQLLAGALPASLAGGAATGGIGAAGIASGIGSGSLASSGGSALLKKFYVASEESASVQIQCSDAWDIYLERIWHLSAKRIPITLQMATGEWKGEKAETEACIELTSKFNDDLPGGQGSGQAASGECDLRPGISLALLWNHMSRRDTFQKVLQRHSTDRDPLNATNQSAITALSSLSNNQKAALLASQQLVVIPNFNGGGILAMGVASSRKLSDADNKHEVTVDWGPSAVLNLVQGLNEAEQVGLPIYEMTRVRQQIFTHAAQLPYYQGLLLYFIAVAYPFLALIVLLPGKAPGFLNVPLAWLWVKSWDIGFAAIILLERVMYNMLPNWSVNPAIRKGPWTHDQLPLVLGEGYNFGHASSIVYHYTILSMVTLAMPAVMAAFTIKGKKAILSNFVDSPGKQAVDAGMRAASAYSISSSQERAQLLSKLGGFATQSPTMGLGGVEGGLKGTMAGGSAAMSMAPAVALEVMKTSNKAFRDEGTLPKTAAQILGTSAKDFLGKYAGGVSVQAGFESGYRAAFDPMYGRWGVLQMSADAAAAALDGAGGRLSGGFETNRAKVNAVDQYMALSSSQFGNLLEAEKSIGAMQGVAINNLISKGLNIEEVIKNPIAEGSSILLNVAGASASNEDIARGMAESMISIAKEAVNNNSEGFDKSVAWAKMWGMNPTLMEDPEFKKTIDEEAKKGNFTGLLFSQIYNTAIEFREESNEKYKNVPGGASTFADPIIEGLGGNRTTFEYKAGEPLTVPNPENRGGFAREILATVTNNDALTALGIESPENLFLGMQKRREDFEKKDRPEQHQYRLDSIIQKTMALDIFSDITDSGTPQEKVKNIIDKAKITIEVDRANGVLDAVIPLPNNIDTLAEENPVTALEVIQTWHRKWRTNNELTNLEISSDHNATIFSHHNQVLSRPYENK